MSILIEINICAQKTRTSSFRVRWLFPLSFRPPQKGYRKVISKDCNLCHTIISQCPINDTKTVSLKDTMEFRHPVNVKDAWKTGLCSECDKVLYP